MMKGSVANPLKKLRTVRSPLYKENVTYLKPCILFRLSEVKHSQRKHVNHNLKQINVAGTKREKTCVSKS